MPPVAKGKKKTTTGRPVPVPQLSSKQHAQQNNIVIPPGNPRSLKELTKKRASSVENYSENEKSGEDEPPPKKYRPLDRAAIDVPPDECDFKKLEVVCYETVREEYSALETNEPTSSQDKMPKQVKKDMTCLTGKWQLYCVGSFFEFLYTPPRKMETWEKCVKRFRYRLHEHLIKNRHVMEKKGGKRYVEFAVSFKPYFGFNPLATDADEWSYGIRIFGRDSAGMWSQACSMVMGSIGTRRLESVVEHQGEQFSFYPFIIARGDQEGNCSVLHCIFDCFKAYHDCVVESQRFDDMDMWRLLTLCLFYSQRIPARNKHNRKKVQLVTTEDAGVDVTWEFDMSVLMQDIRKRQDSLEAGQYPQFLTAEQVQLTRAAVITAYDEMSGSHNEGLMLKSISIPSSISVSHLGELNFARPIQAVSFLFFVSRYRIRKFIYPALSLNFGDVDASEAEFAAHEESNQPTVLSS